MKLSQFKDDTICAPATPSGRSALAVLRVSGQDSLSILKSLCPKIPIEIRPRQSYLTHIVDSHKNTIDQVLICFFENEKSYTGEPSFEISCHGSPIVVQKILNQLNLLGARLAEPGEFTFRAFLNNKVDLIQAEAIHSLIESQSDRSVSMSLRQLDGKLSDEFINIESELIWCLAHIEASIDFSTEGLDVISNDDLILKLAEINKFLKKNLDQFKNNQIIKDGLRLSLAGLPNVGKSSLLNSLVRQNKAIVTDIAGTTRDVIEAVTQYDGIKFNFYDTAGLRETHDQIEKIGIHKSIEETQKSDLNIFVLDCSQLALDKLFKYLFNQYSQNQQSFNFNKFIIVCNKADLINSSKMQEILTQIQTYLFIHFKLTVEDTARRVLFVSTFNENCREKVLKFILSQFNGLEFLDEALVSSARQIEMIQKSLDLINLVLVELDDGVGSEFISQSLKEALLSIQRILGKVYDDQILDRVFKEFCLGK